MSDRGEQIQAEFSSRFGRADDSVAQLKDHLRSNTNYTDAERLDLVDEVYNRADEEYRGALSEKRTKITELRGELSKEVFDAPTASGAEASAFTQTMNLCATSDDEMLLRLAERAATTHNRVQAKAVFVEAHSRGLDHIALRALNADVSGLGNAFRALGQLPTDEELDRAEDFRFPRPSLEDIQPSREAREAANSAENLRRIEYARRAAGSARGT